MNIIESDKYKKSYKKVLKYKKREMERLENIKNLIIAKDNFHELLIDPYKNIYYIEKKSGVYKEYYTARLNSKIRLFMKPVGEYPYKEIEITDIVFEDIDDTHYGEG